MHHCLLAPCLQLPDHHACAFPQTRQDIQNSLVGIISYMLIQSPVPSHDPEKLC